MTLTADTIRPAIKAWVESQLPNASVVWENEAEAAGFQPQTVVRLNTLTSGAVGIDELRWTHDAGEPDPAIDFTPTVSGNREFTLSILVSNRDQRATLDAHWHLEKLRTSLQKPTVRDALRVAGLSLQRYQPIQPLNEERKGRVESKASMDVIFNAVVNDTDTAEAGSYVEKAGITGTLYDLDGEDVGWVDEEFGQTT